LSSSSSSGLQAQAQAQALMQTAHTPMQRGLLILLLLCVRSCVISGSSTCGQFKHLSVFFVAFMTFTHCL
jgi:hypothetical protein